jgi:hypothetical protein
MANNRNRVNIELETNVSEISSIRVYVVTDDPDDGDVDV